MTEPNNSLNHAKAQSPVRRLRGDHERATLYLYLKAIGLPEWADGDDARMLSLIAQWPYRRAQKALERAVAAGYAASSADIEV